ncbi:MAG: chloramphenicol acetyltransferase [Candidatus Marinimicrobia bacterium]|nr:chloramphenicol acetyltransferase [Candidatus Neomarinimicrobiota bacterium]
MQKIDMQNWVRREHFEFYKNFDEPFFGLVADLDCTRLYETCKKEGLSFFLKYLHKTAESINQIEAFKCRIQGDNVVCFDTIHVSATVARQDHSFAFTFIEFSADYEEFRLVAEKEIEAVRNSCGLRVTENSERPDTIHFSALPWVRFTAISHPRNYRISDSIPKISFGQRYRHNKQHRVPVSIHAHHGLADGYHAGLFFEYLQNLLNT